MDGSYVINGYRTDGEYLSNVTPGTTVGAFRSHITLNGGASLTLADDQGTPYYDSDLIRTGTIVTISSGSTVLAQYRVIIYGDISGDGKIDIVDFTYIKSQMLGQLSLSGLRAEAADIDGDGTVGIVDFTYLKSKMLDVMDIPQH